MKRALVFLSLLMTMVISLRAQNCTIMKNELTGISLLVTTNDLHVSDVVTSGETFSRISIDGYYPSYEVGNPELPVMVKMIEIPLCEGVRVQAIAGSMKTYSAEALGIEHRLYPAQRSISKSEDGPFPIQINETTYNTNSFYGSELAYVEKNGIMRSFNLATVYVNPIKYNPVTNEVIVYDNITINITYENTDIHATREMKRIHTSSAFGKPSQVINSLPLQTRDVMTTTPVKYVIVANDMFNGQLDEFVNWKRRKGFLVEVAYTGTVGTTTTEIKNYLQGLYDNATPENPAPTYVLMVGDVAQIPAYTGTTASHSTDLYYYTWTSGDDFPDCYYGRFSAQNVSQLTPQIEKTLIYEQYLMPDPTYLDRALIAAGQDNGRSGDFGYSHADPAMHYLEDNYLTSAYGFSSVTAYYNPHSNASTTGVRTALSNGVGYANYSAHCSAQGWATPSFTTSNVSTMTNTGKFGLMIGNCCESNTYNNSECFGEALLRANNKGAVGYIGGSNSTYWDEDYYWAVGLRSLSSSCTNCNLATYDANNMGAYDKLFHTHGESYDKWFTTQGSMIYGGNVAVQSSTSTLRKYYWEIYILMGDPSVMPWLTQADDMDITIDDTPILDSMYYPSADVTSFTVSTGAPYTYVALTQNLNLIAAALSDANGVATLTFPELVADSVYELAASAQNYKTIFTTIIPQVQEGARVKITNVEPSNAVIPEFNTNITLDVTIVNNFPDAATNTVITATTTSNDITITDGTENVGTVASGTTDTLTGSFAVAIHNAPNGTIAPIDFMVTFLNNGVADTTTYSYDLTISAPEFALVSSSVTEISGNNDNIINPGETISLSIIDENISLLNATNVISELSTYYIYAPVLNDTLHLNTVNSQTQCNSVFTINISSEVPDGIRIPYYHHIYCENNPTISRIDTIYITTGTVSAGEDWENNNFTTNEWVNQSTYPWSIVNSGAYAGTYCAKSGNARRSNTSSNLSITIDVTENGNITYFRKVSSESSYDFFEFYLDGTLLEQKSGTIDWGESSFPITVGEHTLLFSYTKDGSQSIGSDCAWIDNITWPRSGNVAPHVADIHITDAALSNGIAPVSGADITFDATLENFGDTTSSNVTLTLSTTSTDITLTDNSETTNGLLPHTSTLLNSAFAGTINPNLLTDTTADFTLIANYTDNGYNRTDTFNFSINIIASFLPIIDVASEYNDSICTSGTTQLYVSRIIGTDETPAYQWYQNGNPIANETNSTLNINNLQAGTYNFYVQGTLNEDTRNSASITITVLDVPQLSIAGENTTCEGTSITLTATPAINMPFDYNWYRNGVILTDATTNVVTTDDVLSAGTYTYSVEAWNNIFTNDCMATASTTITIAANPTITSLESSDDNICPNEVITLTATSDAENPRYSWTKNDISINTQAATITDNITAGSSTYVVSVTDGACESEPVSITLTTLAQPTAQLTIADNHTAICASDEGSFATLDIDFTGVAPFTFTLTNNTDGTSEEHTINENTFSMDVHPSTTAVYEITSLTDGACAAIAPIGNTATVLASSFTLAEDHIILDYNGGTPIITVYFLNQTEGDTRTRIPYAINDYNNLGFVTTTGTMDVNRSIANANITLPVTGNGTYSFAIMIDGCSYDITVTIISTGIANYNTASISIYPNPTNDNITISMDKNMENASHFDIYDVYGKLLKSGNIEQAQTTVSLNELAAGIYFIQIANERNIIFSSKIVKK